MHQINNSGIKRAVYGKHYSIMDGIELLQRACIEVVYLGEDI
jgi:dCMP deaminase